MAARITEVCDAVTAAVRARWAELRGGAGVAAPDECERSYVPPVDLPTLAGRHVWVFPGLAAGYRDETASRGENLGVYTVGLIVAEKYPDAGRVPREWTDERVAFVEALADLLGSYGNHRASGWLLAGHPARKLWSESYTLDVYDWSQLNAKHGFWSECEFEFREVRR